MAIRKKIIASALLAGTTAYLACHTLQAVNEVMLGRRGRFLSEPRMDERD